MDPFGDGESRRVRKVRNWVRRGGGEEGVSDLMGGDLKEILREWLDIWGVSRGMGI